MSKILVTGANGFVGSALCDSLRQQGMGKPDRLFPLPVSVLEFGASLLGRQSMYQQLCGTLQVDITKAQTLLGWVPPVSVYDGLRRAAQGFLK